MENSIAIVPGISKKESNYRILIVNADNDTVKALAGVIENKYANFKTVSIQDVIEAKIFILSFKPDMVIIGLNPLKVDRFQICRMIKSGPDTKDIKVLLVTDAYPEKIKKKIIECRADGYLSKPFDTRQLSSYLNEFSAGFEGGSAI